MRFLERFGTRVTPATSGSPADRACLRIEQLESRVVPYALSGNAWPNPQRVTLSFVPDGTVLGSNANGPEYSNLFSTFNAQFGAAPKWQNPIISAAQGWAQESGVSVVVVPDNGTPSGQGSFQQGDPGMGDIRIGGFGFSTKYLAGTYQPPAANNNSIAGDMDFNTALASNFGSTYDLQTVALHEFGHAFGLNHSTLSSAVMWPYYTGVRQQLSTDDINGIQAIYGARQPDVYNSGAASNGTFQTAADLTSLLGLVVPTTQVSNLDLTSTSQVEYFTVTAPLLTDGTLTVNVQSSGLSLLRPAVTVYAADQATVLGSASGAGSYNGATLSVPVTGVAPFQKFYIAVTGADSTAFGTGNYALDLSFLSTAPVPAVALPNTQVANGTPLTGSGAIALAVVDLMSVDPSVSCGHSFSANGNPHGGGCNCPLCRPQGQIKDVWGGQAVAAFSQLVYAQDQQNQAAQGSASGYDPSAGAITPSSAEWWLQVTDAYFLNQGGASDAPV
jgi:matrixin